MHSLIKSIPAALGALALVAGCARPNPETPRQCRPRDKSNIARVDADLTGQKEPGARQESQIPGGSLDADQRERRYFHDKERTHLEDKKMGTQFELPLCPVTTNTQTAER